MERKNTEGFGLKTIYSKVSADSADDLIFRNHALFELGQLYFEKCDFPNAVDCLEKVKTEALQFHLYDNYFRSISFLLRIHAERLAFDKHESLLNEVLQVGTTLTNYARYLPKLYANQGIAHVYKREYEEAKKKFIQARDLFEEFLKDNTATPKELEDVRRDLLNSKYCLAFIEKDLKRYADAIAFSETLLAEIEQVKQGVSEDLDYMNVYDIEASLYVLQGQCYRETGELNKALDRYWTAHGILKAHRNWSHYYYVLLGLGRTYMALGNAERAQIFFDLITDAISELELNSLKQALDRVSKTIDNKQNHLQLDRERKVVIEATLGEVHFERRFVLLEILYLLSSQPGRVFTKEDLVDKIWRESYNPMIHDSKVYTSISRLRKLIEPDFKRPIYILNERDGYAFNPAIQLEEVSPRLRKGIGMQSNNSEAATRRDGDARVMGEGVEV